MTKLFCAFLSLVLTVPVFLGMTRIDTLISWLYSENGYRILAPLFSLFDTVGVEGHESVITGVLLFVSLVVSVGVVLTGSELLARRRRGSTIS